MIAIRSITLLSTLAISPAVFSGSAGQVFIDSANVISDCKILQDRSDSNNRYVVPLTKELTCQPDESRRDGKSLGYTIACKYSDNVKRVVSTNKQHGFKTVDDYITIGFHFRDSDYLIGEFTKKLAEEKIKVIYAAKSQCLGTASEIIEPYPVGSSWISYQWSNNKRGFTGVVTEVMERGERYRVRITNIDSGSFQRLNSDSCSADSVLSKGVDEGREIIVKQTCFQERQ